MDRGKIFIRATFQSMFSVETNRYGQRPQLHLPESLSPDPYSTWSCVVSQGQMWKRLSLWMWHILHFSKSEHIPQQCTSTDISYQDPPLLCNSPFITFSTVQVLGRLGEKGRERILGKIVLLVAKLHAHHSTAYYQLPSASHLIGFRLVSHQSNA